MAVLQFVSIVVPTYNRANTIKTCIQSLLSLDYPKNLYEIIVVNDGSTDNTLEVLESYRDDGLKVISHPKNRGPAAARNTGIKHAKGDIVVFVDDDVEVGGNLLSELVACYNANVAGVGVLLELRDKPPSLILKYVSARETRKKLSYVDRELRKKGIDYKQFTEREKSFFFSAPAGCMSYKKRILEELGGFDERIIGLGGEDFELRKRVTDAGFRIAMAKNVKCFLETNPSFCSRSKRYIVAGFARAQILRWAGKKIMPLLPMDFMVLGLPSFVALFLIVTHFLVHDLAIATITSLFLLFLFYEIKEGYQTAKFSNRLSLTPICFLLDCWRNTMMVIGFTYGVFKVGKSWQKKRSYLKKKE